VRVVGRKGLQLQVAERETAPVVNETEKVEEKT